MAKSSTTAMNPVRKSRKAMDPDAREQQMIALAVDLAEKQLREGTASSQVITHFLKLGTSRAELEKEKLKKENKMLEAKTDMYQSSKESEKKYEEVLKAFRDYSGKGEEDEEGEKIRRHRRQRGCEAGGRALCLRAFR